MKDTIVSIIIPVYNRETYLDSCILSVLNQENVSTEIIIVDDGSTDRSGAICDRYASENPNIHVIHKPNGGISDARNCGLAAAHGDYILFVDSDDILIENVLQSFLSDCQSNDADICIGGFVRHDYEGQFIDESVLPNECRDKLVDESGLWLIREKGFPYITDVLWAKLFKREIVCDICFPVGKDNEDTYVLPKIASKCKKIYCSSRIVYRQNMSKISIMRDISSPNMRDSVDAYIEVLDYTVPRGYYNVALMDFGFATRNLIIYTRKCQDKCIREILNSQYKKLCDISKEMSPHFDLKTRIRLLLFRRSLTLYGMVRDAHAH